MLSLSREAALDGRVRVQCPMTLTKRITREAGRFVDRNPRLAVRGLFATVGVTIAGLAGAIVTLVL